MLLFLCIYLIFTDLHEFYIHMTSEQDLQCSEELNEWKIVHQVTGLTCVGKCNEKVDQCHIVEITPLPMSQCPLVFTLIMWTMALFPEPICSPNVTMFSAQRVA